MALGVVAGAAAASDKVYTVANYPMEAAAEDAVAAKRRRWRTASRRRSARS